MAPADTVEPLSFVLGVGVKAAAEAAVCRDSVDPVSDQSVLDVGDFEVSLVHRESSAQVQEGAPPAGAWLTYFFIHCDGVMNDGRRRNVRTV